MSTTTSNLGLFKYETSKDGQLAFNINTALNNNWDKIDSGLALKNHTHSGYASSNHTHSNYALTSHTHSGYASSTHTHSEYALTSHTHSGYISATTSLNTNGYIKFSNSFCLQWGKFSSSKSTENWPIAFTSVYACVSMYNANNGNYVIISRMAYDLTATGFSHSNATAGNLDVSYIATGYKA